MALSEIKSPVKDRKMSPLEAFSKSLDILGTVGGLAGNLGGLGKPKVPTNKAPVDPMMIRRKSWDRMTGGNL